MRSLRPARPLPRLAAPAAPAASVAHAGRAALAGLTALAAFTAVGCNDDPRPGLGGLRFDRPADDSFVTPVLVAPSARFDYPPDAWARGVGGETLLRVRISTAGRVDSVEVVNSAGDAALDSAALASARGLRFRPARRGDTAVAIWGVLPVVYPPSAPASEESSDD